MSKTTAAPKKRSQPKTGDEKREIFKILKSILSKYAPPLTAVVNTDSQYELVLKKPIEIMGVKKSGMCFGSAKIQGSFVGLYLMHVYIKPERLQQLSPRLLKTLKGKTCFHIKQLDPEFIREIELAVEQGINFFKQMPTT
ncbi:MAG: hypothetical protein ACJ749_20405 [Flavisolibacter sp.]